MTTTVRPVGGAGHPVTDAPRVRLEVDGRVAGGVRVRRRNDVLFLQFTVAHGHLPRDVRQNLLEQAFLLPELSIASQRVLVTIPLGDVELLQGLQVRLGEVRVHAAGASCLIEATTC